jgi:O-antigen/teichoic acid export membrane protein
MLEVARFVVRPLHSVFFPVFSEYVAAGRWDKLRARFGLLIAAVSVVGIALAIGMQIAGAQLLILLFGANYQDSVLPARVLFLSVPMMYASFLATTLALSIHREKLSALVLGLCVALNVGLNLVLIPRFGTLGAAWATVASQLFLAVSMLAVVLGPLLHPPAPQARSDAPVVDQLTPPALP